MTAFQVRDYEVWGNDMDGYQVNDTRETDHIIYIEETDSDETIVKKLIECEYLGRHAKPHAFEVEGEFDHVLYVNYSQGGTFQPLCQLERAN